jgi:hypothetical protein
MTKSKFIQVPFLILLALIFGILLISIPMSNEVYAKQSNQVSSGTPTPTIGVVQSNSMDLYAFAEGPVGNVNDPYIILMAMGNLPVDISIGIRGTVNETIEFTCNNNPCKLPLSSDSSVRFQAYTGLGNTSQEYTVIARVSKPSASVYQVILEPYSPDLSYEDSCFANIWGAPAGPVPDWTRMVISPFQLNTDLTLYYLAGSLIQKGVVNVSACSSGALVNGVPNGCGIELARPAMIEWQNKFDLDIWQTSKVLGLPPKILKTLILQETQFWPENSRSFLDEFGLAQINDMGADAALRWDPDLYLEVCSTVLQDCTKPYLSLSSSLREMIRGALLSQLNAQCPTCALGLNLDKAHTSINTIARVVHTNCWETRFILDQNKVSAKSYEDLWKFTMVSYHSGYGCLDVAVTAAAKDEVSIDWAHVSDHLLCQGAKQYIDNFWYSLTTFDDNVIVPTIVDTARVGLIPTHTMMPSPAPVISKASIHILVFVDINKNSIPDPSEGVSGVSVKLTFANGISETKKTNDQGEVFFDLTGRVVGEEANISLVNLYRNQSVTVPETGIVNVLFPFNQPSLPTVHP